MAGRIEDVSNQESGQSLWRHETMFLFRIAVASSKSSSENVSAKRIPREMECGMKNMGIFGQRMAAAARRDLIGRSKSDFLAVPQASTAVHRACRALSYRSEEIARS